MGRKCLKSIAFDMNLIMINDRSVDEVRRGEEKC